MSLKCRSSVALTVVKADRSGLPTVLQGDQRCFVAYRRLMIMSVAALNLVTGLPCRHRQTQRILMMVFTNFLDP